MGLNTKKLCKSLKLNLFNKSTLFYPNHQIIILLKLSFFIKETRQSSLIFNEKPQLILNY